MTTVRKINPALLGKKSAEAFTALIIDAIQDIKGQDIVKIDLRHLDDAPADFFIVCHGTSTTQVSSIANNIYKRIRDEWGILPSYQEGSRNGLWVLVDYFNVVVHVFHRDTRQFYRIEDLWSDGKSVNIQN